MHQPVLLNESLDLLVTDREGIYVDGTLGRGGHAEALLERLDPDGRLVAIDRDEEALEQTAQRVARFGDRATLLHGNFSEMKTLCEQIGVDEVSGILLDLGVSSPQLDVPERGFSFGREGPLDMRMDRSRGPTAGEWINERSEEELADVIFRFGEERNARRIARAVVRARRDRPLRGTLELAEVVTQACGGRRGRIHPATRTFQALRMAVNEEMESLESGLEAGLELLRPGGRIAVISFHSLEDRAVKSCFRRHRIRRVALQQGGEQVTGDEPTVRVLTAKPVTAGKEEVQNNPRARSARLRVAEREGTVQ